MIITNYRVKELRKTLGLTLEKFGERVGVGKTAINKIENGTTNVSGQMFKSICREFNVNEEWLRDGTGEMFKQLLPGEETALCVSTILEEKNPFIDTIIEIVNVYRGLDDTSKRVLENLSKEVLHNLEKKKEG